MAVFLPDSFRDIYRQLLTVHVQQQLPGTATTDASPLTDADNTRLVSYASMLAFSSDENDRLLAYEITTRLVEMGQADTGLIAAADLVLSRIGNFPGRTLLRRRYTSRPDDAPPAPFLLSLERVAREAENTIEIAPGAEIALTDFQFNLFESLNGNPTVSVSAPTSAGKSFVMGLDLVRRLKANAGACVVYLVPTRALIREVSLNTRRQLTRAGLVGVPIRSVPFPITREMAPNGAVYVLTQERLLSLLHSTRGQQWITTVIVDEAQNVGDDARGILLQSAIEAVMIRYPDAEIHFASPLSSNPEFLVSLFRREKAAPPIIDRLPAVSQSIVLISEVHRKPQLADFELQTIDSRLPLGQRALPFRLRGGAHQQRADLARAVTGDDEATILYANRPDYTEELAAALVADRPAPTTPLDPEITELIDFLRAEVHAEYPLINVLPHRVAFHYGYMPAIVRARVEDLIKAEKLRFVCCTSTLLQGVNLPARHIVIENPKCGDEPMQRGQFRNLAGRAGRLLHEFHGTVWCIRPSAWERQSFDGPELAPMDAAFNTVMADGGSIIRRVLDGTVADEELDLGEAALGKLYCDYIIAGRDVAELPVTSENLDSLRQTASVLAAMTITLPRDVLDANRSVRPDRMQELYEYLRAQRDLQPFMPLRPGLAGAKVRMGEIIQLIEQRLRGVTNDSHIFFRWLASQWIFNTPLGTIISRRISFLRGRGDERAPSAIIRELLRALEDEIRFRLVKHYMAYTSVLAFVLRERGLISEAEAIEPLHVYLECGASDRVALSLIALGLSRNTALAARDQIRFPDDATPEDCLAILAVTNLRLIGMPRLCSREIEELLLPMQVNAGQ
jgi:hypothetical protein